MKHVAISFSSNANREKFFESNCLDNHGISENTAETEDSCIMVCDTGSVNSISDSATKFGGVSGTCCGGSNMEECLQYEAENGHPCQFCQFCEYE
jgi:hypothetical protein